MFKEYKITVSTLMVLMATVVAGCGGGGSGDEFEIEPTIPNVEKYDCTTPIEEYDHEIYFTKVRLCGFTVSLADKEPLPEAALEAMLEINRAIGLDLLSEERENPYITVVYLPLLPSNRRGQADLRGGGTCLIQLREGHEDDRDLWIHELLHCFGLYHSTEPGSIMQSSVQEGAIITDRDISNLVNRYEDLY